MNERHKRTKERPQEVLVGYECSMLNCDWTINKPEELHVALRLFGKHNLEKHNGTMHARLTPVKGSPIKTKYKK